jgi:hypothetical protein
MARAFETVNAGGYSNYLTKNERLRMYELLQGDDAIDRAKVNAVVNKTIKSNDLNFFIPEKWNY